MYTFSPSVAYPLHASVVNGDPMGLESLLTIYRRSANEIDYQGKAPLHLLFNENVSGYLLHTWQRIIGLLLQYGADVTIRDPAGMSVLELIVVEERIDAFSVAINYLKHMPHLLPFLRALHTKYLGMERVKNRIIHLRELIKEAGVAAQLANTHHPTESVKVHSATSSAAASSTALKSNLQTTTISTKSHVSNIDSIKCPEDAIGMRSSIQKEKRPPVTSKQLPNSTISQTKANALNSVQPVKKVVQSSNSWREYLLTDELEVDTPRMAKNKFSSLNIHEFLNSNYSGNHEKDQFKSRFYELLRNQKTVTELDANANTPLMAAINRRHYFPTLIYVRLIKLSRNDLAKKNKDGRSAFGLLLERHYKRQNLSECLFKALCKEFFEVGYKPTLEETKFEGEWIKYYAKLPTNASKIDAHSVTTVLPTPPQLFSKETIECAIKENVGNVHKLLELGESAANVQLDSLFLAKMNETLTLYPSSASEFEPVESNSPLIVALKSRYLWPFEVVSSLIRKSGTVINHTNKVNETAYTHFLQHIRVKNYVPQFRILRAEFMAAGLKVTPEERWLEKKLNEQIQTFISLQDKAMKPMANVNSTQRTEQSFSRTLDKDFWSRLMLANTFEVFERQIIETGVDAIEYSLHYGLSPNIILKTKPFSEEDKKYLESILDRRSKGQIIEKRPTSDAFDDSVEMEVEEERTDQLVIDMDANEDSEPSKVLELIQNYSESTKEKLKEVISSGHCDLSLVNEVMFNALMLALKRKDIPTFILEKLITKDSVNYINQRGDSPVSVVLMNYKQKNQEALIKKFTSGGLRLKPEYDRVTYFEVAIEHEVDLTTLELLFKLGLELTMDDMLLALDLRLDALELVLDYVPWRSVKLIPNALLMVVAKNCSDSNLLDTVRRLVEDFKVKLNHVSARSQMSLIHFLVCFGETNANYMSVLVYLLSLGKLDIRLSIFEKGTPLEYATTLGHRNVASRLRRCEATRFSSKNQAEGQSSEK